MKKRLICILLVFATLISLYAPAYAALRLNNSITCTPSLSITNTTAYCTLRVFARDSSDKIEATIKLKSSTGITLKTWNVTSYETLTFNDTYTIVKNKTYQLVVNVKVTGNKGTDTINKTVTASS